MGTKLPVPGTTPPLFPGGWAWAAAVCPGVTGGVDSDFTMICGGAGTGVPVFLCSCSLGKLEVGGYPGPGPGQDGGLLLEGTNCGKGIFPGGLI